MNIEQENIIKEARLWGYNQDYKTKYQHLFKNKVLLDVGMGAGPHSVIYADMGVKKYIGVDPLINTDNARDFRAKAGEPVEKRYHRFPYTCDEIMNYFPNIELIPGIVEEANIEEAADVCMMAAVTEHLQDLPTVFEGIYNSLKKDGVLWFSHCNYYSWIGHHAPPRKVKDYNPNIPEHNKVIDWKHLEPSHPCYNDRNLNRVRLRDIYDLTNKYFIIKEWKESRMANERLTASIRDKYSKYNLNELLSRTIYVTCTKRNVPLDMDLSERQMHHPAENYIVDDLSMNIVSIEHSVYFTDKKQIVSHSTNNSYGNTLLAKYNVGDVIKLNKGLDNVKFNIVNKTVKTVAFGSSSKRLTGEGGGIYGTRRVGRRGGSSGGSRKTHGRRSAGGREDRMKKEEEEGYKRMLEQQTMQHIGGGYEEILSTAAGRGGGGGYVEEQEEGEEQQQEEGEEQQQEEQQQQVKTEKVVLYFNNELDEELLENRRNWVIT